MSKSTARDEVRRKPSGALRRRTAGLTAHNKLKNRYEHVHACPVSFFDAVNDENHVHHESSPGHNRLERSALRTHETVGNTQTSHRRTTQATATRRHAERGTSSNAREASCVKHTQNRPLHAPHFCIRKLHGFGHSCGAGLADVPAVAPRLTCWHVVQENRRQYPCWTKRTCSSIRRASSCLHVLQAR